MELLRRGIHAARSIRREALNLPHFRDFVLVTDESLGSFIEVTPALYTESQSSFPSESATFLQFRLLIFNMKRSEISMRRCANLLFRLLY